MELLRGKDGKTYRKQWQTVEGNFSILELHEVYIH